MSDPFDLRLLVPHDEALGEIDSQILALEKLLRSHFSGAQLVPWHDETCDTLAGIFHDRGAVTYFKGNSGFEFTLNMRTGRTFRSANPTRALRILRFIRAAVEQENAKSTSSPDTGDRVGALQIPAEEATLPSDRIFIVHGHDDARLHEVNHLLERQGLSPVVLRDQPNGGRTIIEKFEQLSDVGYAIILMTADDIGSAKSDSDNLRPRCRQNVLIELGYFVGKLGRSRVSAMMAPGLDIPTDIHGVVYTPLDLEGAWKYRLADELRHAGYSIDKNRI